MTCSNAGPLGRQVQWTPISTATYHGVVLGARFAQACIELGVIRDAEAVEFWRAPTDADLERYAEEIKFVRKPDHEFGTWAPWSAE